MNNEQLRPDLVTALLKFAGKKGGSLDLGSTLLPVVVVEDISRGPYLPCRAYQAAQATGAITAQISYAVIFNSDIARAQSVLVVDKIYARIASAGDDFIIGIAQASPRRSRASPPPV